ncbi:PqqD family peptide modification chaperone [Raineyella sp. LH-20]|uniref:PqqD family peptide modification chaperone n=1 Tax=Raineyella sp. LH-20 TaxID=3081204 RepID=UPI002955D487|nr:PqqD family peptide modification chaperone [Raineyella sp. LH-20]WOP20101.1 PqqD family peptide modification chaperone [Raineyella sp. LH-20]
MRYRWPERIGHVVEGKNVIVALLPDGAPKALDGTGGAIWQLADDATAEEIAAELAEAYGAAIADLLPAVEAFCAELVDWGFLETE